MHKYAQFVHFGKKNSQLHISFQMSVAVSEIGRVLLTYVVRLPIYCVVFSSYFFRFYIFTFI